MPLTPAMCSNGWKHTHSLNQTLCHKCSNEHVYAIVFPTTAFFFTGVMPSFFWSWARHTHVPTYVYNYVYDTRLMCVICVYSMQSLHIGN